MKKKSRTFKKVSNSRRVNRSSDERKSKVMGRIAIISAVVLLVLVSAFLVFKTTGNVVLPPESGGGGGGGGGFSVVETFYCNGDTNWDEQISLLDYNVIKTNFGRLLNGPTPCESYSRLIYNSSSDSCVETFYCNGDTNWDEQISLLDYNVIKTNFGRLLNGPTPCESYSRLICERSDILLDSCGVLNETNRVYTLQNNVSSDGDCFSVSADNVTLDLNGYSILGNGSGSGISVDAPFSVVETFYCNGDTNWDEQISLLDYNVIKTNFGRLLNGPTPCESYSRLIYNSSSDSCVETFYCNGDTNWDEQISLLDYNVIKTNFGRLLNGPTPCESYSRLICDLSGSASGFGVASGLRVYRGAIINFSTGIYLDTSYNNNFNSLFIDSVSSSVVVNGGSNNRFSNSIFTNIPDIQGGSLGNIFLNVTYSTELVSSSSQLIRQWYLGVSSSVPSNVSIRNSFGSEVAIFQAIPNAMGAIVLPEYTNSGLGRVFASPYTLIASAGGYNEASKVVALGGNNQTVLVLLAYLKNCYADLDGDNYSNGTMAGEVSTCPLNYYEASMLASISKDCDDGNNSIWDPLSGYGDLDGDGFGSGNILNLCTNGTLPRGIVVLGTDCNDLNNSLWEGLIAYVDGDGDGYGLGTSQMICTNGTIPSGYSFIGGDCDDTNSGKTTSCDDGPGPAGSGGGGGGGGGSRPVVNKTNATWVDNAINGIDVFLGGNPNTENPSDTSSDAGSTGSHTAATVIFYTIFIGTTVLIIGGVVFFIIRFWKKRTGNEDVGAS